MKRILLISSFLFCSIIVNAQKVGIGFRTGLNLTNFYYSPAPAYYVNHYFAPGFQAALLSEFSFGKIFSIVPEIVYSQQGFGSFNTFTDINGGSLGNYYARTIYTYVNIPVLFRLTWKTSKLKFFMNTGPQLGLFISALTTYENGTYNYDRQYFNSTDFGWALGGGMGIKLGPGWIFGDVRGTIGLTYIHNVSAQAKNAVIGVSFGYIYEFGK